MNGQHGPTGQPNLMGPHDRDELTKRQSPSPTPRRDKAIARKLRRKAEREGQNRAAA